MKTIHWCELKIFHCKDNDKYIVVEIYLGNEGDLQIELELFCVYDVKRPLLIHAILVQAITYELLG